MALDFNSPENSTLDSIQKELFLEFLAFVQENSFDNGKNCLNELPEEKIGMQYNYDFHLHHQLVDIRHILGEFGSFYYNRNIHNASSYGKPNFLPTSHLMQCIDSQFPEKGFLIVLMKTNGGRTKFLFLYPLSGKPWDLCQAKSML